MILNKHLGNDRGMVLLVTLGVISVLIVTSVYLNRHARLTLESVANSRDRLTLTHMAAAGVHAAMALLIHDKSEDPPTGLDSIQEDWADPDILSELVEAIPFETGSLALNISDELGKIQVNTLVKFPGGIDSNDTQMFFWERFLNLIQSANESMEEIEPRTIINSIKDWLDSGDDDAITGLNGAESDYYQSLDPPYECRNGPIAHLDELVLIRGIPPELYYGFEGLFGLTNYITTTFGPLGIGGNDFYTGKININTADLPVIAALLPEGNEILAPQIVEYREEFSDSDYLHDLSDISWYKNAPGCSDVEINPNLITTVSDFFQITAVAVNGELTVTTTSTVQRIRDNNSGKWECKVLSWWTE